MKTTTRLMLAGFLASISAPLVESATPPGIQWIIRRLETAQMRLHDVASNGAGRLMAVGANGAVRISDNGGANWSSVDVPNARDLNSLTWTGTRWVIVGGSLHEGCQILTSTNGTDWGSSMLGGIPELRAVTANSGMVLAVGENEGVARTADLASWTAATTGTYPFNDVIWTGSQFVGVGYHGMIKTSSDGTVWTPRTSGTTESIEAVAWNGSALVAVGYDYAPDYPLVLVSSNGSDWTKIPLPGFPHAYLKTVTWTGSRFVASGSSGHMLVSEIGSAWSHHQVLGVTSVEGLAWDGSRLIAVGGGGVILTTPEAAPDAGGDWTIRSLAVYPRVLRGVAVGNVGAIRRAVTVGDYGTVLTSDDEGLSGSDQVSGVDDNLWDVTATGMTTRRFLAVGFNGTIITSADAVTWAERTSGTGEHLRGANWFVPLSPDPSLAIVVGDNGTILTSPDAVDWTSRTSGTGAHLLDITSGTVYEGKPPLATKRIVAVGYNGKIVSSSGGTTWTTRVSGTAEHLFGVTLRSSGFVAVGGHGTVVTSPDGITWTAQSTGTADYLYGVSWTGSQLVAAGEAGSIYTSPNTIEWTRRYTPVSQYLHAVTAMDSGRLVAVGGDGLVLTSDAAGDFADWLAPQAPPSNQDDPDDDPNGDGITNLAAYAFDIPAVNAPAAADFAALPSLVQPAPGRRMLLRMRPNQDSLGDLTLLIEQSTTLQPGSWTELLRHAPGQTFPSGSLNLTSSPGSEFMEVEFPEIIGSRPACFVRVKVVQNNPP